MLRFIYTFLLALSSAFLCSTTLAQQPIRPIPKTGSCPLGHYSSGNYCVPSSSGNTRGAIEKSSSSCPLGFFSSGNYCLSSPSNEREAIQKTGSSCPLGWFSSGSFCLKSRWCMHQLVHRHLRATTAPSEMRIQSSSFILIEITNF